MINATPVRPLSSSPVNTSNVAPTFTPGEAVGNTSAQTAPGSGTPASQPPKKKGIPLKYILASLFLLLLLIGGGAGLYLMNLSQDVRQQAYGGSCTKAGEYKCVNGKQEVCDGKTWRPTNQNCTVVATPAPTPSAFDCAKGGVVPAGGATCYYNR